MPGVVHRPSMAHACSPGWEWKPYAADSTHLPGTRYGVPPRIANFPKGTVWECDCGTTWVSRGPQPASANWCYGPGMAPPRFTREGRWERRRRLRRYIELDPGGEVR